VSPNRGTPDSSREPAYRRTDTAEPRWNSHCQDGPFEGEARPHAACPNVVDIVAWDPPDRDPKASGPASSAGHPWVQSHCQAGEHRQKDLEGATRTGFPTRPRRGSTDLSAGAGCAPSERHRPSPGPRRANDSALAFGRKRKHLGEPSVRDIETIDGELWLLARAWRIARELCDHTPSTALIDQLLDERATTVALISS